MKAISILTALALAAGFAHAKTTTWVAGGGGDFSNGVNWDAGVPEDGDAVVLAAQGEGVVFNNDQANLSLAKVTISNAENVGAGATLSGNAIATPSFQSECSATVAVPLSCTGNMTIQVTALAKPTTFTAPVTVGGNLLANDSTTSVDQGICFAAPVSVGGKIYHAGNGAAKFLADVTAGAIYYGVYWTSGNVRFYGAPVAIADMSIGAANYYFSVADALAPSTVLTWDLAKYFPHTAATGSYWLDCASMTIDRISCDVPPIFTNADPNGQWRNAYVVGTSSAATSCRLTLRATADAVSYAQFVNGISLVYDPAGDFTQICSNSVHTMNGSIEVKGGTLKFNGASSLKKVYALTVSGGTFCLDSTAAAALEGVTALKVADGGTFRATGAAAGSPFAAAGVGKVEVRGTGKLALGAGVSFTAKLLFAHGSYPAAGTYTGTGFGDETAAACDWIEGAGRVVVVNAGVTSWKGASGNWSDAANWTAGAPKAGGFAYVTAAGGTCTVTVDGGEMPAEVLLADDAGGTVALQVRAAAFTNAVVTVGQGATLEVPAGGTFAYCGLDDAGNRLFAASGSPVEENSGIRIKDGGVFRVAGGTLSVAALSSYFAVGGFDGSAGKLEVTDGRFDFSRNNPLDRLVVNAGGEVVFSGTATYCPADSGAIMGDGGKVAFKDAAAFAANCGALLTGQGEVVYDISVNVYAQWAKAPDAVNFGGTYLEKNNDSVLMDMPRKATFNLNGAALATGVGMATVGGGNYAGGVYYLRDVAATLNVNAGASLVVDGERNWSDYDVGGFSVGYGALCWWSGWGCVRGAVNVGADAAVTCTRGNVSIGVSHGYGRLALAGGTFEQSAANRVFAIGLAGGTGVVSVAAGALAVHSPCYVGGTFTNVLYYAQRKYWTNWSWQPDNHAASGTFRQTGGTATFAQDVLLGLDGVGALEQIGSAGSFSAGSLVFTNSVCNAAAGGTATFAFDAAGVRTVKVNGKLVLGANSKLVVDTGDYPARGHAVKLFTYAQREGEFEDVELTGAFAAKATLEYEADCIVLHRKRGAALIVR